MRCGMRSIPKAMHRAHHALRYVRIRRIACRRGAELDAAACGMSKKEARRFALFVQYAIAASEEAWAQAGIDMEAEDASARGMRVGKRHWRPGGIPARLRHAFAERPQARESLFIPTMIENMAAGNLSIRFGLKADCLSIVTACATGTHCVGEAYRLIRHGYADIALAGGSEESISPICLAGFGNLGATSKSTDPTAASMPFDVNRGGFVPGEGAGALVLESLEHAVARGANILAEVAGFGSTGDAYHDGARAVGRRRGARDAPGAC